ncbi:MAG: chalcone isomerase family protein [Candidatus Binataceae bacterium]
MKPTLWMMGVVAVLAAGVVHAKECKSVTFAEQAQSEGHTLTLNGLGLHQATMLKIDAYVAALYVTKVSSDPTAILDANSPYRLTLQLLRDVGAKDISKGWDEGFERNAKEQLPALKDRIATLNGWMADMKTGEQLEFSFTPGAGLQVSVKGAVRGTIPGDDFGKAFLAISLGARAKDQGLKAGLLGGACG